MTPSHSRPVTPEQQEALAAYLRERFLPGTPQYLLSFKQFIEETLGREIEHWRRITRQEARTVMRRADELTSK